MTKRTVFLNAEGPLSIMAGATPLLVVHVNSSHGGPHGTRIPQDPEGPGVADCAIGLSAVHMSGVAQDDFAGATLGLGENDVWYHLVVVEGIHDIHLSCLLDHTLN